MVVPVVGTWEAAWPDRRHSAAAANLGSGRWQAWQVSPDPPPRNGFGDCGIETKKHEFWYGSIGSHWAIQMTPDRSARVCRSFGPITAQATGSIMCNEGRRW
jgi:hypothetical protein